MCGLLGFSGKSTAEGIETAVDIVKRLYIMNDARGGDSVGYSLVRPDRTTTTYKLVGSVVDDRPRTKLFRKLNKLVRDVRADDDLPFVLLAHNRKASAGANTERNAHPFVFGREDTPTWVVGAHNGTLWNWRGKLKENKFNGRNVEVDSEVIFRSLQGEDLDEALKELDDGSMALTFMKDKKHLVFYTNGSNPLSYALNTKGMMAWSSQRSHLLAAISGTKEFGGFKYCSSIPQYLLQTFDITDLSKGVIATKKVEKKPKIIYPYRGTDGEWSDIFDSGRATNQSSASKALTHSSWWNPNSSHYFDTVDFVPSDEMDECNLCSQKYLVIQAEEAEGLTVCAECFLILVDKRPPAAC